MASNATNIFESDRAAQGSHSGKALFILFIVFQLIGLSGSILMLVTACVSKRVHRHWCWMSFVFSWIISCVSYSFLAGASIDWQPEFPLCLTQAALIYTVPTLTASTSLALIIQVLISIRACYTILNAGTTSNNNGLKLHRLWTFLMISLPYLLATALFTISLVIGLRDRATVVRRPGNYYCDMLHKLPRDLSAIIVTVIMGICLCLGITLCVILSRNWSALSCDAHAPLTSVLRVLCFSAVSLVAVALALLFYFSPHASNGPGLSISLSPIPVAAVLIFGSQTDLVRAWHTGIQACFHSLRSGFKTLFNSTTESSEDGSERQHRSQLGRPRCGPLCIGSHHLCNHSHSSQDTMISSETFALA
ncbi:hypothetical protein FB446DRAFT_387743 [Lentinula raphanica]|nr:hypothetical protein FB446DRAFT_387743 [Lentinula raphanica]